MTYRAFQRPSPLNPLQRHRLRTYTLFFRPHRALERHMHINLILEFVTDVRVVLEPAQRPFRPALNHRKTILGCNTRVLPSAISQRRTGGLGPSWRTFCFRFTLRVPSSATLFPLISFLASLGSFSRTVLRHFSYTPVVLHRHAFPRFCFSFFDCHRNHDTAFHSRTVFLVAPAIESFITAI